IALSARPTAPALSGDCGDRVGRKTTLVAALLTMGVSTVTIGLLPTYATLGLAEPPLLALWRVLRGRAAAVPWPVRPGPRPRRRVGRRGAAGGEKRAAGQAGVVRHVPAAGRADR